MTANRKLAGVMIALALCLGTAAAQTMLDPTRLTKFVDPLPIPAVAVPYETVGGVPHYHVTMSQFKQKLHAQLDSTKVWGYNGSSPGPTIVARTGQPVQVEFINQLPLNHLLTVDTMVHGAGGGVPEVRSVIHLHGGVVAPEYDGWPYDWNVPGQSKVYEYPNVQDAMTLWYHDHAMGITRLNTVAGLAGFYLIKDAVEDALNLPSGAYEVGIALQDRTFYDNGQIYYPPQHVMQFYGNTAMVNGKLWPKLEVDPRKYRFHFLGGSTSRWYNLKLIECDSRGRVLGDSVPGPAFWQIGSDQGLLEHPVKLNDPANKASRRLEVWPGEREDVVIDFAGKKGKYYLLHNNAANQMMGGGGGGGGGGMGGGGCPGGGGGGGMGGGASSLPEIMLIHVKNTNVQDRSSLPSNLRPAPRIPESEADETRNITLDMMMMDGEMMMTLNGMMFDDPVMEMPMQYTTEIWRMINLTMVTHPMHLHLVKVQVLDRRPFSMMEYKRSGQIVYSGPAVPPNPEEMGWKDVFTCPPGYVTRMITRFDSDFYGMYEYHCHLLEHEEMEMMRPFEVMPCMGDGGMAGKGKVAQLDRISPQPFHDRATISYSLPSKQRVELRVYNALGREVKTLVDQPVVAGSHRATWDATDNTGAPVAAGTYFCKLTTAAGIRTRKVTLLR